MERIALFRFQQQTNPLRREHCKPAIPQYIYIYIYIHDDKYCTRDDVSSDMSEDFSERWIASATRLRKCGWELGRGGGGGGYQCGTWTRG